MRLFPEWEDWFTEEPSYNKDAILTRQSFRKVAKTMVPHPRRQTARQLRVGTDSTHGSLPLNDTTISAETKQTVTSQPGPQVAGKV